MYPNLDLFGFSLSTGALMVGLGFLVGAGISARAFAQGGLDPADAWRLTVWGMVGALSGARLWFAVEQVARGNAGWADALLARGGMTWYGGLAGGVLAASLCARVAGLRWRTAADLAAPGLAAGQALGRVGCLLSGDDWGRPTSLPWGMAFPHGSDPVSIPVHPTMVYEAAWLALVSGWLWRRRGRSPFVFGEYLVLAGAGRLGIELLRRNPPLLGPLTNAQLVALLCIAIGALAWGARWRARRGGGSFTIRG